MSLIKQVILAFTVILVLVILGYGLNFNLLTSMQASHDQIKEEWLELNDTIQLEAEGNELIDKFVLTDLFQKEEVNALKAELVELRSYYQSVLMSPNFSGNLTLHDYQEEEIRNKVLVALDNLLVAIDAFIISSPLEGERKVFEFQDRLSRVREEMRKLKSFYIDELGKTLQKTRDQQEITEGQMLLISMILIIISVLAAIWFVTVLYKKTDEMVRSEQLLTLGVFVRMLAHEIKNPLGIIKSSASLIKRKFLKNEEGEELTRYLLEEVERIRLIIDQLVNLQENKDVSQEIVNMNELIASVCLLLAGELTKKNIKITSDFSKENIQYYCDVSQMKQVLLNLLLNAIEASPIDSEIRIALVQRKRHLTIVIKDQGIGVSKKTLGRLFKPFYTTKEMGMGLGLSIVKKILDQNDGDILVKSELGKGSTFEIILPLKDDGKGYA